MIKRPLSRPWGYVLALCGAVLAAAARLVLDPVLGPQHPFLTFLLILLPTAWWCGSGPAILALGLGLLVALFMFLPSQAAMAVPDAAGLTGLALYVSVGLVGIAISEAERRARRRLEAEVLERQRAERRLGESEATLRAFCDNAPVGMGIVEPAGDGDARHLYDNPAASRFLGAEPGTTSGRLASGLVADAGVVDTWSNRIRESVRTGVPVHFEHEYRVADDPHWLSVTVTPHRARPDREHPHLLRRRGRYRAAAAHGTVGG